MPKVDGREVLRRMRKCGNWTPVILLTQVGEPSERAGALDEGADDYLNKPFEPYELLARIRAVLRRSRSGKPLAACRRLRCGALELDRLTRLFQDILDMARIDAAGITIDRQLHQVPPEPRNVILRDDIRLIKSMVFEFVKLVINPT